MCTNSSAYRHHCGVMEVVVHGPEATNLSGGERGERGGWSIERERETERSIVSTELDHVGAVTKKVKKKKHPEGNGYENDEHWTKFG